MAGFGEVARKPRLTLGTAVSDAGVVAVSKLVGTSHWLWLVLGVSSRRLRSLGSLVALSSVKCSHMLNV